MDDPIHTYDFIKGIIKARKDNIVGVAVPNGNRLTLSKGKSKIAYIISLLIIMGPYSFLKNSIITIKHKIYKLLHKKGLVNDPSILFYAESLGIKTFRINTPNESAFIEMLKELNIDVIINQSQNIIKPELLSVPKLGVINRHNALLPKNRGRLTPFWVLKNHEKTTGVSIHFVEKDLDSGDIIVQESYNVDVSDTFNSLVVKNYSLASKLILKALNKLENGEKNYITNDNDNATYNTTPSIVDAVKYRMNL
jgi:methionyl-tRNA formyltransferase